ncbi:MAG: RNA chaperone Hfq [Candidatus Competibacteraceae bacterium]
MSTLSLKTPTTRKVGQATDSSGLNPADSNWAPVEKTQPGRLQSLFLDNLLGKVITVYLLSGIRLVGTLIQHDIYTLHLQNFEGTDSLLFKSGIATVVSSRQPIVARARR